MRRIRRTIALLVAICGAILFAAPKSSTPKKPVHVREYTRKDGTVIQAHDRAAPGAGSHKTFSSAATSAGTAKRNKKGRIERSAAAKHEFERSHPCPASGKTAGACPGYVIDHVKPLACGGADTPENMQWQTVPVGKAKDAVERRGC